MKLSRLLVPTAIVAGSLAFFAGTASAAVSGPPGGPGCTAVTFTNNSAGGSGVTELAGGPKLYNGEEVSYAGPPVTDYWVTDVSGDTFELSTVAPPAVTLHTEGTLDGWSLTTVCPTGNGNGQGNGRGNGEGNPCNCQQSGDPCQYSSGRNELTGFYGKTGDCGPVTTCTTAVITPQEQNYSWVQNTTGETVTVTLDGNYYWVQTRTGNGPVTYLGPKTMTVTLAPGEEISVAWRSASGEHSWCWTGCCTTVAAVPCPVVTTPPCNPRTIVYTPPKQPCRHQDPCTGGRHLTGGPVRSII